MVPADVPSGGSEGLLSLLDEHGEAIEFDLRRFAGVDLLDWFRGHIPTRQILRHIGMLPPESAFQARMRQYAKRTGNQPEAWMTYYAMNDTAEMVRQLWNLLAAINTEKGKKPPTFPDPLRTRGKGLNSFLPPRGAPTAVK